jgi:hypothetical protein
MKTSILISAIVACALSAPIVSAQERPAPARPAMNMDMDMSRLQEKMKAMQAQMDRIHRTTDAKERQRLMQEHMQAMQENMKAMRGMGGPTMGMMGGKPGAKGPGMMDGGQMAPSMTEGDMNKRQDMLEQRTDMMQMMMEQMMQRDQVKESMPHM